MDRAAAPDAGTDGLPGTWRNHDDPRDEWPSADDWTIEGVAGMLADAEDEFWTAYHRAYAGAQAEALGTVHEAMARRIFTGPELAAHDAALIAAAEARGAAEVVAANVFVARRQAGYGKACSTCGGTGRVDWEPGAIRNSDDDQQPCPDCAARPAQSVEDVLAAHPWWDCDLNGSAFCTGNGCTWTDDGTDEVDIEDAHRAHVAAALAEAGIASLAQARAEALNEAAFAADSTDQREFALAGATGAWLRARAAAQQAATRGQGEGVGR
jgi:hypothetical protein